MWCIIHIIKKKQASGTQPLTPERCSLLQEADCVILCEGCLLEIKIPISEDSDLIGVVWLMVILPELGQMDSSAVQTRYRKFYYFKYWNWDWLSSGGRAGWHVTGRLQVQSLAPPSSYSVEESLSKTPKHNCNQLAVGVWMYERYGAVWSRFG